MGYRWTAAEVDQVMRRYQVEGPTPIASEIGRSEDAVTSFANRLGLRSETRRQRQAQSRKRRKRSGATVAGWKETPRQDRLLETKELKSASLEDQRSIVAAMSCGNNPNDA
jgi:hypothetical protein